MQKMHSILVIDDAAGVLSAVEVALSGMIQVNVAPDGNQALRFLEESKVDVLLLDIQMPNMSGWETLQKIRMLGCNSPAIMMSASAQFDRELINHSEQMLGLISKPWDTQVLKNFVQLAISVAHSNYHGGALISCKQHSKGN